MNHRSEISSGPREQCSRGERADTLALVAFAAMFVAYLSTFAVLGSSEYASKFENGELPVGFDGTGGQFAAVTSIVCAVIALVLVCIAGACRLTNTVGMVLIVGALGTVPYLLLELVTWQLAF